VESAQIKRDNNWVDFRETLSHRINGEMLYRILGHAVAQLVEALRYKPEGRGFDSRRCQ